MKTKRNPQEQKNYLNIEVENFGPITKGKISLRPLTIFIGPNNSGKSYLSMLIHSLYEAVLPTYSRDIEFFIRRNILLRRELRKEPSSLISEFEELVKDLSEKKEVNLQYDLLKRITNEIIKDVFEDRLREEIIRSFACELSDLKRINQNSFRLKIKFDSLDFVLEYNQDKIQVKHYPDLDLKIKLKIIDKRMGVYEIDKKENEIIIEMGKSRIDNEFIFYLIKNECFNRLLEKLSDNCYYLPAARSGILQGHKALAASIVRKVPYIGIERFEIPKFSGVVSDFLSTIMYLSIDEKGEFYKLAEKLEQEIIRGKILVISKDEYLYPEIKYEFENFGIPLHRASSTVSELAPLILFLKYVVEPNSVLIIEEPEAHLHPENQRILAKYLVRLVREGVKIIITTHSEYLLEQINNFLMLSKVEPSKRETDYGYNKDDFLNFDEIAAYVFSFDSKSGGNLISKIEISDEGISQEEFLKIHETLYDESFKLQKDLELSDLKSLNDK